jgi:hypothetical protein
MTSLGLFGNIMSGVLLIERSGGHVGSGAGAFIFGVPALGGLYGAARKFWVLTQPKKTDTVPERPRPIASVVESVKSGMQTQGLSFALGGAALMASNSVSPDNAMMLFAGSAFVGLINAARTFGSLSQPAPTPTLPATGPKTPGVTPGVDKNLASPPIEPKKVQIPLSTAEKIAGSLFVGILAGTITFACTMPFLFLAGGGHNMSVAHQNRLMLDALKLSLLAGLVSYQSAYASLSNGNIKAEAIPGQPGAGKPVPKAPPEPTLAERWNRMSKTKRRRIIAFTTLALAALGVAYVGPSTIADKFSEAMKTLADLHEKHAFTMKTKTETKTEYEWIKGNTDAKEMNRLAYIADNLLKDIPCPENAPDTCVDIYAATCAEILNFCPTTPEENYKEAKKEYTKKSAKFHPDKNEKELAEKAQTALNFANAQMKKDKTCGGGEYLCSDPMTKTWTLREPNWLYKQFGVESECHVIVGQGRPIKGIPADCSQVT